MEALRVCGWWLRATVDSSHSGIGISSSWQEVVGSELAFRYTCLPRPFSTTFTATATPVHLRPSGFHQPRKGSLLLTLPVTYSVPRKKHHRAVVERERALAHPHSALVISAGSSTDPALANNEISRRHAIQPASSSAAGEPVRQSHESAALQEQETTRARGGPGTILCSYVTLIELSPLTSADPWRDSALQMVTVG